MSKNTFDENQRRHRLADDERVWLARVHGWQRRFWQGSHDHRGTEEHPGRVVTLIEEADAVCGGLAYLVEASTFRQLDQREKNGYLRVAAEMTFVDGSTTTGLTYIATPGNEAWIGAASEYEIARHIHGASGPSGPNDEYLLSLAQALRDLDLHDEHVFDIEAHLLEICAGD